jgi:hypothetical protein
MSPHSFEVETERPGRKELQEGASGGTNSDLNEFSRFSHAVQILRPVSPDHTHNLNDHHRTDDRLKQQNRAPNVKIVHNVTPVFRLS